MMSTISARGSKTADRRIARHAHKPLGELRAMRKRYNLSQALLARLMDVSLRSISAAESQAAVPAQLRRGFTIVSRLCQGLAEIIKPQYVAVWLDQPNEMLSGLKPVEAIERGQLDLVWQAIEGVRSGLPL